jgi:hypothetical protein
MLSRAQICRCPDNWPEAFRPQGQQQRRRVSTALA